MASPRARITTRRRLPTVARTAKTRRRRMPTVARTAKTASAGGLTRRSPRATDGEPSSAHHHQAKDAHRRAHREDSPAKDAHRSSHREDRERRWADTTLAASYGWRALERASTPGEGCPPSRAPRRLAGEGCPP